MNNRVSQRAVVVGASSGIGRATAQRLAWDRHTVLAIGRDEAKLRDLDAEAAGEPYGGRLTTTSADATSAGAMRDAYAAFGRFDHLVLSLSSARGMGEFSTIDLHAVRAGFEGKYWPQVVALQEALPFLEPGGSVTFVTAASSGAAYPGTAGLAAINGALEAMIPVLAVELAPTRVNAVSPGVVDTPWWSEFPREARDAVFAQVAERAPAGRVGRPEEIASAIAFLTSNAYVTGNVLRVDGGARLRY